MMLIVGGAGQGKLAVAVQMCDTSEAEIIDGASCDLIRIPCGRVLYRLHLLVRRLLEAGMDPTAAVMSLVQENPALIVVSDEIGCGIVPMQPFEREWREMTGRLCCHIAQESAQVVRVVAGIPTILKGARE